MGIIQEFREFAIKGNALDLAVGVIIGLAFGKIVNSIVNDIAMPPLGWLIGGVDFKDLKISLQPRVVHLDAGKEVIDKPEVAIMYGNFLNTLIEFFIVAVSVFIVIKMLNKVLAARGSFMPGLGKKP
ncbi:MAG: large conductance mechanosensitive channel protein MscL [Phycisphaerae bacterium]|mgnify:CR=1 FL=1|nr:large conductance mechanosensitive channel protein MscL [Phycisphaerae bacterium]